ncbi:MAG: hypothetical protein HC854_03090 [Flavobacterium sp.]|nr:hypothetical protein [Flavobacterium sp.]
MTRTRIVGGKIIETTGGDYNIYTKENIIYSAATTITETGVEKGVSYGKPITYTSEQNPEVEVKIIKNTFLPLGLSNFKGIAENKNINIEVKVRNAKAENLTFYIKHNKTIVFSKKIGEKINPGEKITIQWDGFSDSKIYDSSIFTEGELTAEVTGANDNAKDTFKSKYNKVKWVDVKIDNNTMIIEVTLRVNLKDGGVIGDAVPKYSFSDLERMTLEGLNIYWSRNKTRLALVPSSDFVTINKQQYLVTVNAINSSQDAMDDINLIYNSTADWKRSSNPGSVTGVLSFFANIFVPERVVFNAQQRDEERDFKLTSAHEIGHEIIKAFGGDEYSYSHQGSSTLLTQQQKENPLPSTGENNLMEYYSDAYYDYDRTLATEKDVLGLLWCSILKIK